MEDHSPPTAPGQTPESTPVVLGPKDERREKSDRHMLRAAIALISKHGSVGASLAQIGLDAGYSRGLPAQRFGTKLKLLETVADATAERFDQLVAERTAGKRGCEALAARIRAQMEAVRDAPEAATAVYHLMVDAIGSVPELKPRVAALHEGYRRSIRKHVLEARQMGELQEGVDVEETVRAIQGVISGLCLQALIAGDTARLTRDAEVAANLLIGSIRKTS
ncbi:TetR family transcriptional regulator C-terminal domain-containing protein [uncultured Albimonas sp.]|uniref:TetR/AcrR family transcriptional regulator n=1 Tax=uncultured Albimonas sp. TaxID=1331701 RepID=UPI0030EE2000|tara:strand:- start:1673 stop:2338 length:666 start_codon:yes stop_codon:yes gene_type:complete